VGVNETSRSQTDTTRLKEDYAGDDSQPVNLFMDEVESVIQHKRDNQSYAQE
jgi:hypothetical protein